MRSENRGINACCGAILPTAWERWCGSWPRTRATACWLLQSGQRDPGGEGCRTWQHGAGGSHRARRCSTSTSGHAGLHTGLSTSSRRAERLHGAAWRRCGLADYMIQARLAHDEMQARLDHDEIKARPIHDEIKAALADYKPMATLAECEMRAGLAHDKMQARLAHDMTLAKQPRRAEWPRSGRSQNNNETVDPASRFGGGSGRSG